MDWPPQSPGLNIIESAWDHFYLRTKQKVANIQRRPLNFFTPIPSFRTSHAAHETCAFILKDQRIELCPYSEPMTDFCHQ